MVAHVAPAQVVGEDEEDVGPRRVRRGRAQRGARRGQGRDHDEEKEPGNNRRVEGDAPRGGQVSLSSGGETGTGDPQEHTRLRTAHSILRRRPQAGQPR